jgi:hypothetical protein
MYEEFNSIKNDVETLLIRLRNLELQIRKFDKDYIINTKQLRVYLSKQETVRILGISERELELLCKNNYFTISKKGESKSSDFLLEEVIWLKNQNIDITNPINIQDLIKKKRKIRD